MDLNKIIIGSMRLRDCSSAAELIRKAVDSGCNYIDTAPLYRYESEQDNSEVWVGKAVNSGDCRSRIMVSTKSATSNGRLGLGEFDPAKGFGVRTADQFCQVFQQSLDRMNVDYLDFYHLWICHTQEQFTEAMKQGGWYEGYLREKAAGRVKHLGITTHADSNTIISFLDTSLFEAVTLPLNVLNRTRIKAVDYCREKGIKVIAMNPLGGGFLGHDIKLRELAFKYLLSLENVSILLGFTTTGEVEYALKMKREYEADPITTEDIIKEAAALIPDETPKCTSCGYCQPCPQFIEVGASLSYYNLYKYLGMEDAKAAFNHLQWNQRFRLDLCTSCGLCEKRCPNALPVRDMIKDAVTLLY